MDEISDEALLAFTMMSVETPQTNNRYTDFNLYEDDDSSDEEMDEADIIGKLLSGDFGDSDDDSDSNKRSKSNNSSPSSSANSSPTHPSSGKRKQNSRTVDLEPHIDPYTLAAKDTTSYMHVSLGSRTVPSSDVNAGDQDGSYAGFGINTEALKNINKGKSFVNYINDSSSDAISVNVTLDTDGLFGIGCEPRKRKYAMFSLESVGEHPILRNTIVKGVPVKSCLFTYHLKMVRPKFNIPLEDGFKIWECKEYSLIREPITVNNYEQTLPFLVYQALQLEREMADRFIHEFYMHFDFPNVVKVVSFTWSDCVQIFKRMGCDKRILKDKPMPELIRYLYPVEVHFLTGFYKEEVVLHMMPKQLTSLYEQITTKPFDLFFLKKTSFCFRVTRKLTSKDSFAGKKHKTQSVNNKPEDVSAEQYDDNTGETEETFDDSLQIRRFLEQLTFNKDLMHSRPTINYALRLEIYWIHLPELPADCITKLPNGLLTQRERSIIKVYNDLKKSHYVNYHSYETKAILMESVETTGAATDEDKMREFDAVMEWLTTNVMPHANSHNKISAYEYTLVKTFGRDHYYLRDSHLYTMSIIESLQILFDRYTRHIYLTEKLGKDPQADDALDATLEGDAAEFIFKAKDHYIAPAKFRYERVDLSALCDEQMRAVQCQAKSPLTAMFGRAGSGKTTAQLKIISGYVPGTVWAVAFQGRNVAALSSVNPGFSYTAHMLIYLHKKYCATECWSGNNLFRKKDANGEIRDLGTAKCANGVHFRRCILENMEVLIIEELSLMTLMMFSIVLCIGVRCGRLTKVIISGDPVQLPALGAGDVIKQMLIFCKQMGVLVEFTHNHRNAPEFVKLHQLSTAIYQRDLNAIKPDGKVFIHEHWKVDRQKATNGKGVTQFAFGAKAVNTYKKYNIDIYNSLVVARSNNIKDSVNFAMDKFHKRYPSINEQNWKEGYYNIMVGSKITFKKNLYLEGNVLINNEMAKVIAIEDYKDEPVRNADGSIRKMSPMQSAVLPKDEVERVVDTSKRPSRGYKRRLVIESLDHAVQQNTDQIMNNPMASITKQRYIPLMGDNRSKIQKAYAQTIHGAQGGEYDTIVIMMPYDSQYWTREAVNTAVTRAKKRVILLGSMESFIKAIKTDEPYRNDDLGDLLIYYLGTRIPEGWEKWKNMEEDDSELYQSSPSPQHSDSQSSSSVEDEIHFANSIDWSQFDDVSVVDSPKHDNARMEAPKTIKTYATVNVDAWVAACCRFAMWDMTNLKSMVFKLRRVSKQLRDALDSTTFWFELYKNCFRNTMGKFRMYHIALPVEVEMNRDLINNQVKLRSKVIDTIGECAYRCTIDKCNNPNQKTDLITSASIISAFYLTMSNETTKQNCRMEINQETKTVKCSLKVCSCGLRVWSYIKFSDVNVNQQIRKMLPDDFPLAGVPVSGTLSVPKISEKYIKKMDCSFLQKTVTKRRFLSIPGLQKM